MLKKKNGLVIENREKGFAAIEFVLTLPLLLMILGTIVEYGWLFKTQIEINNAVSAAGTAVINKEGYDTPKGIAISAIYEALEISIDFSMLNAALSVITAYDEDLPRAEIILSGLPYTSLTGMLPESMLPGTISAKAVVAYP